MILKAIVIELCAQNKGRLPLSHGRLLHAAFLNTLRVLDPEASARLHNAQCKQFSLGLLQLRKAAQAMAYNVEDGEHALWRIAVMGEDAERITVLIQEGLRFRVGSIVFLATKIYNTKQQHPWADTITTEALEHSCAVMPEVKYLTLNFITPAAFRYFEEDYPFPKPELVFGSAAERWNNINGEEYFDVELIKQVASKFIIPDNWHGQTRRVNLTPKHGVTAFEGSFCYKLTMLPQEYRALFIVLARFAAFAGVGRLTGQGLGQVRIQYK